MSNYYADELVKQPKELMDGTKKPNVDKFFKRKVIGMQIISNQSVSMCDLKIGRGCLTSGIAGSGFIFMNECDINDSLESENIQHMQWPTHSPDINPIEHVWDMLDR
ncbi:hypothetical protein TNCV_1927291 [Trichonephila clavipes]|nr:hypothetical protein TNCV_1927291 [Trichonephila clavipes]